MEQKKRNKWILPAVTALVLAVCFVLSLEGVRVYLTPKTVLTSALMRTAQKLEDRFSGSPIQVLGKGLDRELDNTIQLQMNKNQGLLGDVQYDLTIQNRMWPRQLYAEGTARTSTATVDLKGYADERFAAIASDGLLNGQFYGITYETFSQDIRKNSLLAFLIGEDTITQWEESVTGLESSMDNALQIPEFSAKDLSMAVTGLLALKPKVSRDALTLSRGQRECYVISFQVDGELILSAAEYAGIALPVQVDQDSTLESFFYLAEGIVVRWDILLHGNNPFRLCLMGDTAPETDTLTLAYTKPGIEHSDHLELILNTVSSDALYTEELTIQTEDSKNLIRYSWNRESGDGQLSRENRKGKWASTLNLTATEDGFRVVTEDLEGLLAVLGSGEDTSDSSATLTVTKGSSFSTPGYKNLDQWSMEDLMTLLGGLGGLLGLKI